MPQVASSTTRLGALLLGLGAAPFLAGAALSGVDGPRVCPFSIVTGTPCPFCGSTRSFSLAATGDPAFLRFNAVWVIVAAVAAVGGGVLLVLAARGRARTPTPSWGRLWPVVTAVVAVAWAWALVQRDVIVG